RISGWIGSGRGRGRKGRTPVGGFDVPVSVGVTGAVRADVPRLHPGRTLGLFLIAFLVPGGGLSPVVCCLPSGHDVVGRHEPHVSTILLSLRLDILVVSAFASAT